MKTFHSSVFFSAQMWTQCQDGITEVASELDNVKQRLAENFEEFKETEVIQVGNVHIYSTCNLNMRKLIARLKKVSLAKYYNKLNG